MAVLVWAQGAGAQDAPGEITLLAFGDSLTAGYGLAAQEAFPSVLEKKLRQKGYAVKVINGGVSGDTTLSGAARLEWVLGNRPDAAIVELGANDALRGLSPAQSEANLTALLKRFQELGIPVLLAGMYAPPNMGEAYAREFNPMYERLAERFNIPLYPFFLEGVAGNRALNQPDGIHPTAEGVEIIVERILPAVEELLRSVRK